MSDRLTRSEVLKLSLDEYINLYVPADQKGRICGRRGPYPSQAQQRRRYEHSHYFAPAYQRQQQHQQQQQRIDQLRQQEQQQQTQNSQKAQQEQQWLQEKQEEPVKPKTEQQDLMEKQQQTLKETLETLCIGQDCLSKLRQEQQRLQQQSVEEMRLLQQRLRLQRQQGVEEMRMLQQRHRQQRLALQQRIDEEVRSDYQNRFEQHFILQQQRRLEQEQLFQEPQSHQEQGLEQKPLLLDQLRQQHPQHQQQRIQQLFQKLEQRCQIVGFSDYKMLLKLEPDVSPHANAAGAKGDTRPTEAILPPPTFVIPELPRWYKPPDDRREASHVKKLLFDFNDGQYATSGISTEEVIAEIEDQMKEEIEMEDDINSDMLYIPTNFSLNE